MQLGNLTDVTCICFSLLFQYWSFVLFLRYSSLSCHNINLFVPETVFLFRDCLIIMPKEDLRLNGALSTNLNSVPDKCEKVIHFLHFQKEVWENSCLIAGAISRISC